MIFGVTASQATSDAVAGGGGAGVTATFDPANKSSTITLTNGDLTATQSAAVGAGARSAKSTNSRNSGKYYFEWRPDAIALDTSFAVGLADAVYPLNTFVGSTTVSVAYYASGHGTTNDGGSTDMSKPVAVGEWARIAVDFDTGKFWVGDSTGWAGDPGAGTGNVPGGFAAGTTLLAMFSAGALNDAVTVNFGATLFQYTVPAGFTAWDGDNP